MNRAPCWSEWQCHVSEPCCYRGTTSPVPHWYYCSGWGAVGGGGGPTGGVCQEMSLRTGGRSHLDPLLLFLQLSDSSIDWT